MRIKAGPARRLYTWQSFTKETGMSRLMLTLFSMISTTLMGVGVVVALTTGNDTLNPILIAAAIGFVLAIPVSWWVARQLA